MRVFAAFVLIGCTCFIAAPHASANSFQLKREDGVLVLPVRVNDSITLNFTIDSGAADVVIPLDVFTTLSRAGTITSKDMLDSQTYELADGTREKARRFRIRSLKIGDLELHDVVGSIAPTAGTLLLGQSFLSHLPSWSIDNQHDLLVVGEATHAGRSRSNSGNSPSHRTRSPATAESIGPTWVLVGTYPERGHPDQIFQFIDAGEITEPEPGVHAAWVKVAYWFDFTCGVSITCSGPTRIDFDTRLTDSDVQHAITRAGTSIKGGSFLAEFNCSTGLTKSLESDKWRGVEPGSIDAVEEQLVCAGNQ
jgi:clan AA aspartic protease (TIGR02281 family)